MGLKIQNFTDDGLSPAALLINPPEACRSTRFLEPSNFNGVNLR
jgi:hypothetical protein